MGQQYRFLVFLAVALCACSAQIPGTGNGTLLEAGGTAGGAEGTGGAAVQPDPGMPQPEPSTPQPEPDPATPLGPSLVSPASISEHAARNCGASAATPKSLPLAAVRPFTSAEYLGSVQRLFGAEFPEEVRTGIANIYVAAEVPTARDVPFSTHHQQQRLHQELGHAAYNAALRVASWAATYKGISQVLTGSDCLNFARIPADCLGERLFTQFVERAFRTKLVPTERQRLLTATMNNPDLSAADRIYFLVARVLSSPLFFYRHERGEAQADGTVVLTPLEAASALAFEVEGALPDAELWAVANDGMLLDPKVFTEHHNRLRAGPSHQAHALRFFDEWFRTNLAEEPVPATEEQVAFVGNSLTYLRESRDHFRWLLKDAIVSSNLSLSGLFQSTRQYVTTPKQAQALGVQLMETGEVDRQRKPVLAPATFELSDRPGPLSRPFFLLGTGLRTHPIHRGLRVQFDLLCNQVPDPPPGVDIAEAFSAAELQALSTREMVEKVTSPPNCAGCHALMNPPGFALETFDNFGRLRTEESLITKEGTTKMLINSTVTADIGDKPTTFANTREFLEAISRSPSLHLCAAIQVHRFRHGREPDTNDYCAVAALANNLAADQLAFQQAWVNDVPIEVFRRRRLAPGQGVQP